VAATVKAPIFASVSNISLAFILFFQRPLAIIIIFFYKSIYVAPQCILKCFHLKSNSVLNGKSEKRGKGKREADTEEHGVDKIMDLCIIKDSSIVEGSL
jgi:hypothetical protein